MISVELAEKNVERKNPHKTKTLLVVAEEGPDIL
jgi:hypothetical protein